MTGSGSRRRDVAPQSATEIETEIRRTRMELGLTLEALEHQLAPRHLIGKGVDMITQSIRGNQAIKGNGAAWVDVGEAARANPIPLALIGVGVAWFLAANFGITGGSAEGDAASGTGAARSVREAAGTLLKGAGECAEYGKPATEPVRRTGRSLRASVERHPLLVGLAGLICGAALGALLPSSRREQDWVDAARGELWEKAEQIGHEAADRVRGLAEQKVGAADR
jgi:Protein of unknown function (DUF3618)